MKPPRTRPIIAMPGRFSRSASALRYEAVVNARALLQAVYDAGGDPVTVLPTPLDPDDPAGDIAGRLAGFDGVLMPGGADVDPHLYGQEADGHTDPADAVQDEFDLAVLRHAVDTALPLMTVCRGTQLLNVMLGGTLEQDMARPHQHTIVSLELPAHSDLTARLGSADLDVPTTMNVSCYHHQRIAELATGLTAIATSDDGTVEAVRAPDLPGWVLGVQWHPEDTAVGDVYQRRLLETFIAACRAAA
ncbi:type 1 glutamine amidotransferase [Gordonia sp. TBRC 11910]|uniref:Type 1 glutamine amidotransferase n=1 Tax=Gordonia asplenii TaxID=2725283 RepID=A0A848L037_9ACTN|nr:type 1 glutamine amidotransferase [Gordonia asplenii]NMO02003.1 type 1 glutamine amidotransferase [Gordonia asplenii]